MKRYRIRRCQGNRSAWLLCVIRDNGSESDAFGSYTTGPNLNHLLAHAGHLTPTAEDEIEFITDGAFLGSALETAMLRERLERIERALANAATIIPSLAIYGESWKGGKPATYTLDGVPVEINRFISDNQFDPEEVQNILRLKPDQTMQFGGGAMPVTALKRES